MYYEKPAKKKGKNEKEETTPRYALPHSTFTSCQFELPTTRLLTDRWKTMLFARASGTRLSNLLTLPFVQTTAPSLPPLYRSPRRRFPS